MNKTATTAKRSVPEAEQIDVRAGHCNYGDMVSLGRVLDKAEAGRKDGSHNEIETIEALIRTLHPDAQPRINLPNVKYALAIAAGVRFWREQENEKLKYEPTAEERQAGYEKLAALTGPTGVASTIAEKFGVHDGPDAVFKWPYARVFMVLYIDLERFKFNKRLSEIRETKRKQKEKASRWGRRK